jgi:hypothetical protein
VVGRFAPPSPPFALSVRDPESCRSATETPMSQIGNRKGLPPGTSGEIQQSSLQAVNCRVYYQSRGHTVSSFIRASSAVLNAS